jgi:hypothetical protein
VHYRDKGGCDGAQHSKHYRDCEHNRTPADLALQLLGPGIQVIDLGALVAYHPAAVLLLVCRSRNWYREGLDHSLLIRHGFVGEVHFSSPNVVEAVSLGCLSRRVVLLVTNERPVTSDSRVLVARISVRSSMARDQMNPGLAIDRIARSHPILNRPRPESGTSKGMSYCPER